MLWFELQDLHHLIPYLASAGLVFAVTCASLLHLMGRLEEFGIRRTAEWPEFIPSQRLTGEKRAVRSILRMIRRIKISPDDDSDECLHSLITRKIDQRGGYQWTNQKDSLDGRYGYTALSQVCSSHYCYQAAVRM
ncbi:hypothetical protein ACFSVM_11720 [Paenibacillus shunpengii]|uniref:Uncharacterized protein n=1 Tax=Paenibacillus shunpengii TaxID=2054424 RepID=A0ABW5SPA7_9BACL|nr:hypothetical protein [Paenibacillus sp. FSL H7-0326]